MSTREKIYALSLELLLCETFVEGLMRNILRIVFQVPLMLFLLFSSGGDLFYGKKSFGQFW